MLLFLMNSKKSNQKETAGEVAHSSKARIATWPTKINIIPIVSVAFPSMLKPTVKQTR